MGVTLADQPDLWGWANEVGATEIERYVVWLLKAATAERPIGIAQIISRVWGELHLSVADREIKSFVRSLRRDHGMPVLARRGAPSGYYWCRTEKEMASFVRSFMDQARDEMATIRRMLTLHYPGLVAELDREPAGDTEF